MFSQYLKIKEREGVIAIFHELHPDPVFCSQSEWAAFLQSQSGNYSKLQSELRQRGLIIDSISSDEQEFKATEERLQNKLNQPVILYLMMAQGCNLECRYCPVPGLARQYGNTLLSTEDAIAGINLWQEHLKDVYDPELQYFVIFYGGEPLLNREVIKASLAYLQLSHAHGVLPANLNLLITTNGLLVDEEIVSLCQEYGVMVAVGLDGLEQANDTFRVDREGNGTFDQVVRGINLLVKGGVKTFASVSLTPANLGQLTEISSFLYGLGVEKIGFNFLKGRALVELVGVGGVEPYYHQAARAVIDHSYTQPIPHFEYQMEKKVLAFEGQNFFPVDCTCYGNQLVIQPDGQISNCPFSKTWLGQVRGVGSNFRIWEQKVVQEWRQRLSLHRSSEAKALCGGGCAWSVNELEGNPVAEDKSSRVFSEEVLDELIWLRYKQLVTT